MISYSTNAILLLHIKIFLMEVLMVVRFSHCMTEVLPSERLNKEEDFFRNVLVCFSACLVIFD